jgi:hypothetical protein
MASKRSDYELVRCNICRCLLPCRLPRCEAADRCGPCQMTFWSTTRAAGNCRPAALTPEQEAEKERRIELYTALVSAGLPLFPEPRVRALQEAC